MKLGCGYPMGPFTLLDFVGLDTTYYITHVMYDEFKERRFASPPLLKRLVMARMVWPEVRQGFYDYAGPARRSRISCDARRGGCPHPPGGLKLRDCGEGLVTRRGSEVRQPLASVARSPGRGRPGLGRVGEYEGILI